MNFSDLAQAFERAARRSCGLPALCFLWIVLTLCGVLVVFCRGFGALSGFWGFTLAPLFLTAGLIVGTGVVLVRSYLDEGRTPFHQTLFSSWDVILSSAYLGLPLFLAFLCLWVLLGVFALLFRIPFIGTFFGIVLAFIPYTLIFAIIVLCALALLVFFFAAPPLARRSEGGFRGILPLVFRPLRTHLFASLVCFLIALFPVALAVTLLLVTQVFTEKAFSATPDGGVTDVLQWFFLMIPFVVFLAPPVHFFFNFAAETTHLLGHSSDLH